MMIALALASLVLVQDTTTAGALRVFLDCPNGGCDFAYLRTEIRFVNWVRDRQVADVHTLVTRQDTGGGTEFTLTFIGLREYAAMGDTLRFNTSSTDTEDEQRRGLAQSLRLGLVRYAARTPLGRRLAISMPGDSGGDDDDAPARQGRDPWNFWVFEISVNGNARGEESTRDWGINGSLEASRVTERWKWEFELDANKNQSRFQLDDTTTFTSERTSWSFDGLMVKSLGQHWSAGALMETNHQSFRNTRLVIRAAPAIEYNFFPYRESTRRILTVQYAAGIEHARYQDTTIYDKTRETHPIHNLEVSFEFKQPWGSASAEASFFQYLHDPSKVNLGLFAEANIRLIRGLSLNFYGGYEMVRHQLYLAKGGDDPLEIIARQRAQATNYSYHTGFGLSYTFGSIFNNVVNPRF